MIVVKHLRAAMPILVLLSSVGTGSLAVAAPPKMDPCSLLTTAEVEQVIGKLKGTPSTDKMVDAEACYFEFTNGKDAFEIRVGPGDAFVRVHKDAKQPVTVKGLGDDAFMDRGAHGLNYVDLTIKKGAVLVQLAIKETAGDEDKLKTLGQKAVKRF